MVILRCIEKYNDALNQDDLSHRFMCFWRLCEYALQPCDEGRQKLEKVESFIKNFRTGVESGLIARILCKTRNKITHHGEFNDSFEAIVVWMQETANYVIENLLFLQSNKIKTKKDIQEYFSLYPSKFSGEIRNKYKLIKLLLSRK